MPVSFSDVLSLPAAEPDRVSAYGSAPQQFGELWLPGGNPDAPLVILIHGGCWQNGYGVDHVRPLAGALRSEGYLVWAIEYRRIGDDGGGWPGTFQDTASAIDHLQSLVEELGLEPAAGILMGHSAGGQLALWAAARSGFPAEHPFHAPSAWRPDAVIGLAAISDMVTYAAGDSGCEQSAVQLLGTPGDEPSRYWAVSPLDCLPLGVPSRLVHGAQDPIVNPSQSLGFARSAADAGDDSSAIEIPGAGHFDLVHPGTPAWRRVMQELKQWT